MRATEQVLAHERPLVTVFTECGKVFVLRKLRRRGRLINISCSRIATIAVFIHLTKKNFLRLVDGVEGTGVALVTVLLGERTL